MEARGGPPALARVEEDRVAGIVRRPRVSVGRPTMPRVLSQFLGDAASGCSMHRPVVGHGKGELVEGHYRHLRVSSASSLTNGAASRSPLSVPKVKSAAKTDSAP
jgi:hypothetical protein